MAESLVESYGSVSIHKLRGSGMVSDLGVHGCARSRSQDSGLVADLDSCQDTPDTLLYYRHHSIDEHIGTHTPGKYKKAFGHSRSMSNPLEKCSKFPLSLHINGNLNRSCDGHNGFLDRTLSNGHQADSVLDQSNDTVNDELDQSADTIQPDDDSHSCSALEGRQSETGCEHGNRVLAVFQMRNGHDTTCETCEANSQDTVPKLNPRKLDLRLNVQPIDVGPSERIRTISGCSDYDGVHRSGKRSRDKALSAIRAPPPKQSWLLRLFESKLFDMSIAITYLFNSKEPGVQTYIGKYTFSFLNRNFSSFFGLEFAG